MKDKKLSKSQAGGETDQNNSAFEKFETEVRNTIFNVLYVLLKDDEHSHWKHLVLILTDFLQIWQFSFAAGFNFPWKGGKALEYLQTFFDFFQVTYWMGKLSFVPYIAVFYILIFIIFLVILDIFYVSYSFTRQKFSFVWPLQLLRSVCSLIVTTLFLPFLESFTSILHCSPHHDDSTAHRLLSAVANSTVHHTPTAVVVSTSAQYLHLFPDVQCWVGSHIIHATIGLVVSFLFIVICLIVSLTFFDSNNTSHDISARVNSRSDIFVIILKIVMTYVYLFVRSDHFHWFQIVLLNVLSITAYSNFRNKWPYFNDKMNKYFCVMTGIFAWANLVLIIVKAFEHTLFDAGLQIYFLGLPLIVALILFEKDKKVELLCKTSNNFQRGEDVSLQVRYFLQLVMTRETQKQSDILLKGYIFHHEDSCMFPECHLKLYKTSILQAKKGQNSLKKHLQKAQSMDQQQLLLSHAQNMYKQGIRKFPNCTSLMIQYAIFLMESLHKKNEAIAQLNQAQLLDPPFDEQFLIFRYKKIFEDFRENGNDGHSGGLDVVSKYAYESSFRQCQQHIVKSAQLHLSFWNQLMDDRPDIAKLNECGSKINQSVLMVENYWNQLQKLNSNVPKALRMYARFLIEILNDKEGGQELIARSKDAANVKQNFYDGNNLQEDVNDIQAISLNGTPCIYVSGETNKIGLIQNCNSGASRIFGFTPNEMKNHNVEKLMPEMYAKNHSKILDEALAKGQENIPNKERLVFARHKSGYIFPIWLQLKMVSGTASGIQFVALFKIDKKLITSDIAYILINKDKKLHGLSSSCMPIMNLDISKMRKLSQSGINITKLAPKLFKDNCIDQTFQTKQGGVLEWFLPEFGTSRKELLKTQKVSAESLVKDGDVYRTIQISKKEMLFKCHVSPILMGYLGEIGWYLKLDSIIDNSQKLSKYRREQEKIKQPLFQFRFDDRTGKFIRELRDNLQMDNAAKDPNFSNGLWQQLITPIGDEKEPNINESIKSEENETDAKTPAPVSSLEKDIIVQNQEFTMDIFEKKRQWSSKIETYRLQEGVFVHANHDDELKKQQLLEEQRRRRDEEQKQNNSIDGLKNNIKSRKALQAAINNKAVPGAITNLRVTMNLVILCLLALSITEFVVINKQFTDINENFSLISFSRNRISEVQKIAYNVRTLVLMNEQLLTNTAGYSTETDFKTFMQADIENSLDSLYQIQNNISLSTLSVSPEHKNLIENKTVSMVFKDSYNSTKILKFSLTDSVLQLASAVFTVKYMSQTLFSQNQEDVWFITYNAYNEFLMAIRQSAQYYMEEILVRTGEKNQFIQILFYCSIGMVVLAMAILCPVVGKVNLARMKILSLFVDIPNYHVVALATKCEDFITKCQEEDQNDEIEMDDNEIKIDDSDVTKQVIKKRNGAKQPKNSVASNSKVFMQFIGAALVLIGYWVAMFLLATGFISKVKIISSEMNVIAQAESYYALAQNVQREMIYDPTRLVLGKTTDVIARDTLQQLYGLNSQIILRHNSNKGLLDDSYLAEFEEIYKGNLCTGNIVQLTSVPVNCADYLSSSPTHGLQTVLVKYFETLREELSQYYKLKEAGTNMKPLLNSQYFADLYIIQFRFISDSLRKLVQVLSTSVQEEYQNKVDIRMAIFICFVIVVVAAYLIIWLPFISKLNREIWRTKAMLTIIPIEVILKIPRIQEFLLQQSFFSKKAKSE